MIGVQELAEYAGITPRQLDFWVRQGYLTPEPRTADHQGYRREFNAEQMRVAVTMAGLVKAGILPEVAHVLAEPLNTEGHVRVGKFLLVRVAA